MSFVENVWKGTKRRLGFYGGLLVVGAAGYGVYQIISPDARYLPGPYGVRDTVVTSYPIWDSSDGNSISYSTHYYRTTQWTAYKTASDSDRRYVDRAFLNYRWGYTFADGNALEDSVNARLGTGYGSAAQIQWPLPTEE
jgi:hypothetical protein